MKKNFETKKSKKMKNLKEKLQKLNACDDAIEWVGDMDFETAWAICQRGDWMLWLAKKLDTDSRILTSAKAECAALVMHLMKDPRSIAAIEAARAYARGEIDEKQLLAASDAAYAADAAAYAAYAAAYSAAAAAHASAAYAATAAATAATATAYAAAAAYTAAYAAANAAHAAHSAEGPYAATAAAYTAAYAAANAARNEILRKCADICRSIIQMPKF